MFFGAGVGCTAIGLDPSRRRSDGNQIMCDDLVFHACHVVCG